MNTEIFIQIAITVMMVLGALVARYVIPFVKSKIQQSELTKLMDFALKAVRWANQTIPRKEWERKRDEVMDLIINYMDNHLRISLTEDEIRVIMEAFVNEVKKTKNKEE